MKKVLVLEDEANIRGFIVINLRRAGYEVIEAESGEEALEKLSAQRDIRVALLAEQAVPFCAALTELDGKAAPWKQTTRNK